MWRKNCAPAKTIASSSSGSLTIAAFSEAMMNALDAPLLPDDSGAFSFACKRAIVFGGAGFIGSHLLARLAAEYPDVELFSVDAAAPRIRVDRVHYVEHDVSQPIPSQLCGAGGAVIFNLAAVHTTPGHEDWEYYHTNVLGACNVCRYATDIGAQQIVFTSSIAVYGPTEAPRDEDSAIEPVSAYGRSKAMAEAIHELWRAERPGERRIAIVRPAVIYGQAERGNFTRLARLLAKGRFVYPGRKDAIKSCGYVKDLVSSMLFMAAKPGEKVVYNFCYPERYTSEDICAAFFDVAAYKRPRLVVPIRVMLFAALAFEVLNKLGLKNSINRARIRKLFQSTNIIPKRLQEARFHYGYSLRESLADWRSASQKREFT
jgi:GlcNAc-P-P-Und epimerase